MHVALLEYDSITIKQNDKSVKLYRIISTGALFSKIPIVNKKTSILEWSEQLIEKHTIGGYVESLSNVGSGGWVEGNAKIWGEALITNTILSDSVKVFGKANIVDSYVGGYATIYGNSEVSNSWITDQTTVKDNAKISSSKLFNSAMIFGSAEVSNSLIQDGCYVMKQAKVDKCILKDTAMVGGTAHVIGCSMSNQASFVDGEHRSKNVDFSAELGSIIPEAFYDLI